MEGILGQVYDHLDNYGGLGASSASESMEVDSGIALIKRQSSTGASQILGASQDKPVEFVSDFVSQKHSHKDGSFRCVVADRATKSYISENMQRR